MKVKIKKLNEKAVLPKKGKADDMCYDVVAVSRELIAPRTYRYGIGLAFELCPKSDEQDMVLSIDFRPRSSIWKTGMILSNSAGTIDYGYRGEVCAVFYHVIEALPIYEVGDRIGQIKIGITTTMEFEEVEELTETERGAGGYGSTGR